MRHDTARRRSPALRLTTNKERSVHQNIILAGVGGQGILTIARAISTAALARGRHIKQAEVHGMSQRGGAVQSHLRIADEPLYSDLIPAGKADLLIATEPLESLRYVHMLSPDATVITATNAVLNIGNYPAVEQIIDQVAALPNHVVIDADRLARAAGSGRSGNIALLGAASLFLDLEDDELDRSLAEIFAPKGDRVVEVNQRAMRFGKHAAAAYLRGLEHGGASRDVRRWVDTLDPERLAAEQPDSPEFEILDTDDRLSGAEAHAVERLLLEVHEAGRSRLHEHEVYQIIQLVGAISPPHHVYLTTDDLISEDALNRFPSDQVVLKIVSPDVVHKSDAKGLVFCSRHYPTVKREIDSLIALHRSHGSVVHGVLIAECVETAGQGLGEELFVGIRATREFGPVIAAGLGGVDMEYLARVMQPGRAVAKAVATETSAEGFFEIFQQTAAYDTIAGHARGHRRTVSDGELLRCFRAFIAIARRFCVDRGIVGPDVAELEVNPFAFRRQRLVPLDGRGRLATATIRPPSRPIEQIRHMLEPRSIALVGVSAKDNNFGRIILRNILSCGFDPEHLRVVKPDATEIDSVSCVPSIGDLPEITDLLVVAAAAEQLPQLVNQAVDSGKIRSIIVIPGGVGETEGSGSILEQTRAALTRSRANPDGGPVLLGPNCLGVQSRPGLYDTFFIPDGKLDKRRGAPGRPVAFLSQSGAFIISRLSKLQTLDPLLTVSIGNQADLTIADMLRAVGERPDIHTIGVYVEGFNDLDGLDTLRAIRNAAGAGKTVVFYKAGRTEQGRSAAAGHTASVAGDYDICEAGALGAGALIAETFAEFEQLLELSAALHDNPVAGTRLGAVSNAGFETVGMADRVRAHRYEVQIPDLCELTRERLAATLKAHKLAGLVNVRNPLDLTPMAGEVVYETVARAFLDCPNIDALIVSVVPLTPALATTADEIAARVSLADILPRLAAESPKPIVAVIDSGSTYEPLVSKLRESHIPVFRAADQAVRSLGRYLCHRVAAQISPHSDAASAAPDLRENGTIHPASDPHARLSRATP